MCTDCDYCGDIRICFETEGHGTCCVTCADKHGIKPLEIAEGGSQPEPIGDEDHNYQQQSPFWGS